MHPARLRLQHRRRANRRPNARSHHSRFSKRRQPHTRFRDCARQYGIALRNKSFKCENTCGRSAATRAGRNIYDGGEFSSTAVLCFSVASQFSGPLDCNFEAHPISASNHARRKLHHHHRHADTLRAGIIHRERERQRTSIRNNFKHHVASSPNGSLSGITPCKKW